ncbi:MAG TPA: hypothetical protein DDW84_01385 [Phycisphaerales bacterium]|nr:MAG: hypothetical protein A2Y13_01180 [Planctomycetes bacterium GWC2_45_44]HBG77489.1 hypothetical protein [Phycisphaerales bacterium]HBR19097.1 hypothetical protein [Phycisphaerales bacterium]
MNKKGDKMEKVYGRLISIVTAGYKKATKYIDEKYVIKATCRSLNKTNVEVVLTAGRPNNQERKFIAQCKAAGEKFPIKKIQLKAWTSKKK